MSEKHGPWTIEKRESKYENELIQLYEDRVIQPDGEPGSYASLKVKAGVSVLALDSGGFVYLAKEFRYAVGRETLEAVGGAIDEGESKEDAARRELREELGIEAEEFLSLGRVDPITSLVDAPSYLFLARNLTFTESEQEGTETIRRVKLKFDEALHMALDDRITQGSTCILLFRADHHLKTRQ